MLGTKSQVTGAVGEGSMTQNIGKRPLKIQIPEILKRAPKGFLQQVQCQNLQKSTQSATIQPQKRK